MKILRILLYIVLGIAALVVVLGLFAKKDYHIERSIEIDAPKSLIHNYVRFYKNFDEWSPWAAYDPNMTKSIEGTDGEVGATYKWSGNDKVGIGEQKITGIKPDRIDMSVTFKEPWESTSPVFIGFEDKEGKTKVSWGFDMHVGFPWNGLSMFMDVDAGVGKDYEIGLETLKKNCEKLAIERYKGLKAVEMNLPAQTYAGVRKTMAIKDLGAFWEETMPKTMEAIGKSGAQPAGAPAGLYWKWDMEKQETDMAVAVPVGADIKLGKGIQLFTIEAGKALVMNYKGGYEKIGDAHEAMDAWITDYGYHQTTPVIESYVTDPTKEPDTSKWVTKVIYYIK